MERSAIRGIGTRSTAPGFASASPGLRTMQLRRLQPVMADAPFAAADVTEQARSSEQEPAPAPHPQRGLAAMDLAKRALDFVAMAIEVIQPILRGALIVHAAPAPFLFDLEQIGILPDQMMARHHAAGKEPLRDPVLATGAIEQIGAGAMGEDVQEEPAAGLQPCAQSNHQFAPVQ